MIRRPPRFTRTDTLFPYTTLFRSTCATTCPIRKAASSASWRTPPPPARRFSYERLSHDHRPAGHASRLRQDRRPARSEEHTSELQSLMRISYAVFCLTKKKNILTISQLNLHKYT